MHDLTFWTVAVAAVFMVGLSKSGLISSMGLIAVPLLALVMPPRDAAGMMLPLLLVMDVIAIWTYRRDANWTVLWIMIPGAMVGTIVGWVLWAVVTDAVVNLLVGLISVAFVFWALSPLAKKIVANAHPSKPWGTFWAGVAGFTSFISHTGGPPFQIYVLPQRLAPVAYAGTTAFFFGIVNTSKVIPYWFLGQLNVSNMTAAMLLTPVAIAGVLAGVALVRRISTTLFYYIAYAMVFVLGVKLIYDGVVGMLQTGVT
jgi:uncharacterized membrane protein YfcA